LRVERVLLVAAPAVAMATVALGLRVGAGGRPRAAVVFGAPASGAGTGLAWQVIVFEEDGRIRQPVALAMLEVTARAGGRLAHWSGPTNDDGVAEILLDLPNVPGLTVEVSADGELLAGGDVTVPELPRVQPEASWARFARRDGAIGLDVAVLGQRVASGFPASIWVRASDAESHSPLSGVTVEPETDASLTAVPLLAATDSRGWAHIVATPMGYGVALMLHGLGTDGRRGDWAGALFASPGAAQIVARDRYAPDEQPTLEVVMPSLRTVAYVEIDDMRGRAWAAAVPLSPFGGMPRARVRAPKLAPGLYWAVAASDPAAGAKLDAGTIARPFFVAASDDRAVGFGLDSECLPSGDSRRISRVVEVCLALASATAVPRWTALDGFVARHARDGHRRELGLAVALAAIVVAMLLEAALLLRAARTAHERLREATAHEKDTLNARVGRVGGVAVALLVALLGFALIAAFLVRAA
jgi:hypothetical protein